VAEHAAMTQTKARIRYANEQNKGIISINMSFVCVYLCLRGLYVYLNVFF